MRSRLISFRLPRCAFREWNRGADALSRQVPDGLGAGLFYWSPEWIPGVGWEPGAGTPNDNLTLFNFQGTALPSIGIFQNPAAVCQSYDRYDAPCVIGS